MESAAELGLRKLRTMHIVAVGLVDHYTVGHLHDAAFDSLKLVARSGNLKEQEEVDHRMDGGLALPDAYGLDEYIVVTGSFAENYRFTRLTGHASERAGRRAGTDESLGMDGETFHARLISENASAGALARRVNGEHSELCAFIFKDMKAEDIDRCAFTGARNAGYSYTAGVAGMRQTVLDYLARNRTVFRHKALDERHGTAQKRCVAAENALGQFGSCRERLAPAARYVGINLRRLFYTSVDGEAVEFFIVFDVFHGVEVFIR